MQTDVTLPQEGQQVESPPIETPPESVPEASPPNPGKVVNRKSPFKKAKNLKRRIKVFFWGDSGVGKSITALNFPRPVVIDMESGTDLYGEDFSFDVLHATNADEVMESVEWLLHNQHEYCTLIIDPITVYWEALQKKWSDIFLLRNKGSKGYKHDYYDIQPKDWLTIKGELKDLIRKMLTLDMNVIVTAREKTKYKDGSFMVPIGETFDGEKSLPYMFDTVVRLYKDDDGRHMGRCLKDRSKKLPKEDFECSYQLFEQCFGKETLSRQARPVEYATEEQKAKITDYIQQVGMTPEQVNIRLAAYDADSLDNLILENAEVIISKLEETLSAMNSQADSGGTTSDQSVELATEEQKVKITDYIQLVGMTPEQVAERLAAYEADCLDSLNRQNAVIIISKLEEALAKKNSQTNSEGESNAQN